MGGLKTDQNIEGSICPKGWKLPYAGEDYNNTSGSFYYLLEKYGLQNNFSNEKFSMTIKPLYFNLIGQIAGEGLNALGYAGSLWSSVTSSAADRSFEMTFTAPIMEMSFANLRQFGFSIRCLAH